MDNETKELLTRAITSIETLATAQQESTQTIRDFLNSLHRAPSGRISNVSLVVETPDMQDFRRRQTEALEIIATQIQQISQSVGVDHTQLLREIRETILQLK